MLDTRREVAHIWREYSRYQRIIGEEVVWFKFDTEGSEYDSVYEEGGRDYERGIRLPILWVDQVEDPEQYQQDGAAGRSRGSGSLCQRMCSSVRASLPVRRTAESWTRLRMYEQVLYLN